MDLTPEQRECTETVRRSGEALLTVINDILDFSEIEAGKLQIESFPFDLRTVIEEVKKCWRANRMTESSTSCCNILRACRGTSPATAAGSGRCSRTSWATR